MSIDTYHALPNGSALRLSGEAFDQHSLLDLSLLNTYILLRQLLVSARICQTLSLRKPQTSCIVYFSQDAFCELLIGL